MLTAYSFSSIKIHRHLPSALSYLIFYIHLQKYPPKDWNTSLVPAKPTICLRFLSPQYQEVRGEASADYLDAGEGCPSGLMDVTIPPTPTPSSESSAFDDSSFANDDVVEEGTSHGDDNTGGDDKVYTDDGSVRNKTRTAPMFASRSGVSVCVTGAAAASSLVTSSLLGHLC